MIKTLLQTLALCLIGLVTIIVVLLSPQWFSALFLAAEFIAIIILEHPCRD